MTVTRYDPRNATSSWHGFVHQGKVGIFLALKEIKLLLEQNISQTVFDEYFLEYESAEDIDIRKNDYVLSRHQVKAKKNSVNRSSYTDVFEKFDIYYEGNIISRDCRFLHTIVEVHDFNDLEQKEKYEDTKNIKLYEYPDGNQYCSIEENVIRKHCDEYIYQILKYTKHPERKNDLYRKYIYYQLLNVLDNRIREGHINERITYPIFTFLEIFEIIHDDKKIEDELIEQTRTFTLECLDEFLYDLELLKNENINEQQVFRLRESVNKLLQLDNKNFIEFIMSVNPDIVFDIEKEKFDTQSFAKITNQDALNDIFFELLYRVGHEEFDVNYVGYNIHGGYHLTFLNSNEKKIPAKIRKISRNSKLAAEIFNKKYIINGRVNNYPVDKVFAERLETTNWDINVENKDSIVQSNAEFINIEDTITKLNEGDEVHE